MRLTTNAYLTTVKPVDNLPCVQVAKRLDDTGGKKARNSVVERAFFVQQAPEITSQIHIRQEINKFVV